jgi:hypothetical protein
MRDRDWIPDESIHYLVSFCKAFLAVFTNIIHIFMYILCLIYVNVFINLQIILHVLLSLTDYAKIENKVYGTLAEGSGKTPRPVHLR